MTRQKARPPEAGSAGGSDRPQPARRGRGWPCPWRGCAGHPVHGQGNVPDVHGRRHRGRWLGTDPCPRGPRYPDSAASAGRRRVRRCGSVRTGSARAPRSPRSRSPRSHVIVWRMPGGSAGYLRDMTASIFVLAYLPLMAVFAVLMLASRDGLRPDARVHRAHGLQRCRRIFRRDCARAARRWCPRSARRRRGKDSVAHWWPAWRLAECSCRSCCTGGSGKA